MAYVLENTARGAVYCYGEREFYGLTYYLARWGKYWTVARYDHAHHQYQCRAANGGLDVGGIVFASHWHSESTARRKWRALMDDIQARES